MICIIDYGVGNLGSILNMLKRVGAPAIVSSEPDAIRAADRLILPGVGAFDTGMRNLAERELIPVLEERALGDRVPVLGLCLGAQLLTERSEEGSLPGLGWIPGETVAFALDPADTHLKVPHMGWSTVRLPRPLPLFEGLEEEARFYFVHSYHLSCPDPEHVLAYAEHGDEFPAAIGAGNVLGVQFHPEKSHRFGMRLLKNFAELV